MAQSTRTKSNTSPSSDGDGNGNDNSSGNRGKKEHVRKKVWRPKTKTGCITCRIRRVKCDEAKPSCNRCTSTGRKCDGYTTPAPSSQSYELVYAPTRSCLSSMPGLDLNSTEEQEAFHFFKYHSSNELSGFFDAKFWQFEILQASHTFPAIRHALIALATMHRKFIVGRMPVVPDDITDKQLRFALYQTNQAIQAIISSPSMTSQKTISDRIDIMTSCILFHSLACIQGHQSAALEHLRSGLKILREVDDDLEAGLEDINDHPISLNTLRAMFVTMDVQARGIMSNETLAGWGPQPKRDFALRPTNFKTFGQARYFFDTMFNDVLAFVQDLDIHPPTQESAIQSVIGTYQRLQAQFDEGSTRLETFLSQLSQATSQEDRESVISIRLMYLQVKVFLRVFAGFDGDKHLREINWHIDEHDMGVMLDLACELLKAPPELAIPAGARPKEYYPSAEDREHTSGREIPSYSRPVFSGGSGLLSALWLVCSRARTPALRRRAIALLLDYPRREGVWDSVLAGRVAWETLILEETAVDGDLGVTRDEPSSDQDLAYIPECNRVRDIAIAYTDTRMARIEFRSVRQYEAGEQGFISQLAW